MNSICLKVCGKLVVWKVVVGKGVCNLIVLHPMHEQLLPRLFCITPASSLIFKLGSSSYSNHCLVFLCICCKEDFKSICHQISKYRSYSLIALLNLSVLGFSFLCSMTKPKEHSREICYAHITVFFSTAGVLVVYQKKTTKGFFWCAGDCVTVGREKLGAWSLLFIGNHPTHIRATTGATT